MKLKRIFVNNFNEVYEGLWTVSYPEIGIAEFSRLISKWKDIEFVTNYLEDNAVLLQDKYFEGLDIDALVEKVIKEAESLFKYLKTFTNESFEGGKSLETIFRIFDNKESVIRDVQAWKYRRGKREFPKSILRLYAIRIAQNTFVITGGAIKIVEKMSQHPDLIKERSKIQRVISYLKENGVDDSESFKCYINEV